MMNKDSNGEMAVSAGGAKLKQRRSLGAVTDRPMPVQSRHHASTEVSKLLDEIDARARQLAATQTAIAA
jgi:hypothetical protein